MKTRPQLGLLFSAMVALGGCTGPWVSPGGYAGRFVLPRNYTVARPPLLIHSDFPLPAHDGLLDELAARPRELGECLGLPPAGETVHVYLFDSPERFREFLHARHPNFPDRRAFFVETDTELAVYAQGGRQMADDLRHEMTHAYLHSVVPKVPLWLDEGLAKYFELPTGRHGLNGQYVRQIADAMDRGGWHPQLARLEQLPPTADMSQEDYVEAWAWVHFLLDSQPACRDLLRRYLADLRGRGKVTPLRARLMALVGYPEWELLEHMRKLAAALPQDAAAGSGGNKHQDL